MKRLLVLVIIVVFVITGCGKDTQERIDNHLLYTHKQTLEHSMEGVIFEMNYLVQQLQSLTQIQQQQAIKEDSVMIEMNAKVINTTDGMIYYTPNFYVQTVTGERFENVAQQLGYEENSEQYEVPSGEEKVFTIAFKIPKTVYDQITTMEFFIPAGFKEPDSESSGDALGDTATWQLPIK